MATDKRKRAIRALAAERGISYTTAMRLHDAPRPNTPLMGLFTIAGEPMTLERPLLLVGDPGSGLDTFAADTAADTATAGATVVIVGDPLPLSQPPASAPAPGVVAAYTSGQSPLARARVLSFLEGELERRREVLAQHGTRHWWGLSAEVRRREGMTHPVLVIDTLGPEPLEGTDTGWGWAAALCERLDDHGGAVGVGVLRVRSRVGALTVAAVQRGAVPVVGLARCAVPGPAVKLVVETLGEDVQQRRQVLDALPGLGEGQIVWLEWGNDPEFWPAG